jgi:hypothetical protein
MAIMLYLRSFSNYTKLIQRLEKLGIEFKQYTDNTIVIIGVKAPINFDNVYLVTKTFSQVIERSEVFSYEA